MAGRSVTAGSTTTQKKIGIMARIGATLSDWWGLLKSIFTHDVGVASTQKEKTKKEKIKKDKSTMKRLFGTYFARHWPSLTVAIFFMAIVAIATTSKAWLMKPILDSIFIERSRQTLTYIPIMIFVIFAIRGIAEYLGSIIMNRVMALASSQIRLDIFGHLLRCDLSYFHENESGKLVSKFTSVAQSVAGGFITTLVILCKDCMLLLALMALMIMQDWRMFLVIVVVFSLGLIVMTYKSKDLAGDVTREKHKVAGNINSFLSQAFQGIRQIKAFQMERVESNKAKAFFSDNANIETKQVQVEALRRPMVDMLAGIAIGSALAYGGSRVLDGEMSPGSFFVFVTSAFIIYRPLKNITTVKAKIGACLTSAEGVFDTIDNAPNIVNHPKAKALVPAPHYHIDFKDVGFSYGGKAKKKKTKEKEEDEKKTFALDELNISVEAGKTTALVGPSGGGKSTIFNLIPRFYDVHKGAIEINGSDIRMLTIRSLRAHIALVSQDIFLMNDTIAENIKLGATGRTTKTAIVDAAKRAAAHDFIMALPKGYDTPIGENGVSLSGGQRQRISIARAIIKNAPILLLDEATSSLDSESESLIQSSLKELRKDRTTLVIAHRLSTIRDADKIYVILNGQVAEHGTHSQLCRKTSSLYKQMLEKQSGSIFVDMQDNDTQEDDTDKTKQQQEETKKPTKKKKKSEKNKETAPSTKKTSADITTLHPRHAKKQKIKAQRKKTAKEGDTPKKASASSGG
ncbi:MAG: ATP-binding cassette domain-containing protein [Alphaproteobacteria bacterium GM7ARS4]|nr:ATP-binding cassette domain-containing protein [Alphaproteobacteria bacterium GM7ARS4]